MAVKKGLSWNDTTRFGIDDETGELYWEGKKVMTGQIVTLQRYERFLATIVAIATLAAALHPWGASFGWW